jgi:hypothetical protein
MATRSGRALRRAFDATMKDPAFLAEAEKSLFDVDPLNGEEMEQILRRAHATRKRWCSAQPNSTAAAGRDAPSSSASFANARIVNNQGPIQR